jgi:transcriptional regulator with XRE-family HTH domain
MDLGFRIKQFRTLKKLSQKEVAMAIDMNQGQYSRIESGKVEPTLSSLKKIASVFEVSISELLNEENDLNKEINIPLLEKIKLIDLLDDNEKNSIMTIIDMAISKKKFKDNLSNLLTNE